ncbi:type II secretion system minor pseudopilin GspK [Aurantivibrio plasticivorans]
MKHAFSGRQHQRGTALILAMMIVVVVTLLGVQFEERFTLSIAKAENRWHGLQAQNYLLATETLAAHFLEDDANNSDNDHLGEVWATEVTLPTDDGMMEVKLEDAQGRFNLNSLAANWTVPGNNPNPPLHLQFSPAQRRFIRLLQIFEDEQLTQQEAIEITEAVIDWVDDDGENLKGFGGAESLYYNNLSPPYTPANQLFFSVSELQMVKGITPALYQKLEPLVAVLPDTSASLNVNTALPEVLRSINDQSLLTPLSEQDVATIVEERTLQAFEDVADFSNNAAIKNAIPNLDTSDFGVSTNFFLMHAKTSVGEQIRYVRSGLSRTDGKVTTVSRRYTSY